MNCRKPSVNKALKNLRENELVSYEIYGKIELTKSGEEIAKRVIEANDIIYLFLKDILKIDKESAKMEAE